MESVHDPVLVEFLRLEQKIQEAIRLEKRLRWLRNVNLVARVLFYPALVLAVVGFRWVGGVAAADLVAQIVLTILIFRTEDQREKILTPPKSVPTSVSAL